MFKPLRHNRFVSFRVLSEDLLLPLWNLTTYFLDPKDMLQKYVPNMKVNIENINQGNSNEESNKEKIDDILNSAFRQYNNQLISEIMSSSSLEQEANVLPLLMVFQIPTNSCLYYIADNDEKDIKGQDFEMLKKYIIKKKLVSRMLDKTDSEQVKRLKLLDNPPLYNKIIDEDQAILIEIPILPASYVNIEDLDSEDLESGLVWFNKKRISSYCNTFPEKPTAISLKTCEHENIGLLVDNYFFPLKPMLNSSFLKPEYKFDYIWLCIKYKVLYNFDHKKKKSNVSDLVKEFLLSSKDDQLVPDISRLQDNLYIESDDLSDQCKKYFDRMLIIEDLKKLHTYKFYIDEPADTNESTVLGIYQKVKLDEDYQLKYLFESHGKKLHDKQEGSIEQKSVWVLKPKIAQFFISNFFEQFLFSALSDIKGSAIEDYVENYHAQWSNCKDCELDAIVKTSNNIYFVEAKTTLSVRLINEYITKCKQIIRDFEEIDGHLRFLIIGYFSNPELNVFSQTVKKEDLPEGYNEKRADLHNIPYYFKVPIDDIHDLICFTELSYDKLKSTLTEVFKE